MFNHKCGQQNHQFEARYDKGPATNTPGIKMTGEGDVSKALISTFDAYRPVTYIHDICVYCGEIRGMGEK